MEEVAGSGNRGREFAGEGKMEGFGSGRRRMVGENETFRDEGGG